MKRAGFIALLCAIFQIPVALSHATAPAAADWGSGKRVALVFMATKERSENLTRDERKDLPTPQKIMLKRLINRPELAVGYLNATQGTYSQAQALLDMAAGTRVSAKTYDTLDPPRVKFTLIGNRGYFLGWPKILQRADSAPATIKAGILATDIPGGAGYAGYAPNRNRNIEGLVATDQTGHIARASLGTQETVGTRALELLKTQRFVVVSASSKRNGGQALDQLRAARGPGDLLLVVATPPDFTSTQLLPMGVVSSEYGDPHRMSSATTRRKGIVAGIDIAPTVLDHLDVDVDDDVRGQVIEPSTGTRSLDNLEAYKGRLSGISRRRIPTLQIVMLGWVALLFALGAVGGWHQTRRRGLRIGAIAVFWSPTMVLASAVADPKNGIVEGVLVAVLCFVAAFLTDRFVPWPRGPAVPCFTGLAAYTIDLARDSDLIARSLLGPNPRFGSRFFGLGNELETALPIMLLLGLAAYFSGHGKSRKLAGIWAGAGLVLMIVMASGRLGASVGAVFTVGAGFTAACLLLLPERPSKKMIAAGLGIPFLALGGLAVLDLATSGDGHFTRTVLRADSFGDVVDVALRRYELAFDSLIRGRMPAIVLALSLAVAFAWRNRAWLYKPLSEPVWTAALMGCLSLAIIGSVFNDSGPLLFVIGVFTLGVITAYVQGDPRLTADAANVEPIDQGRVGESVSETPETEVSVKAPPPATPAGAAG